jgi:hypothetical protein
MEGVGLGWGVERIEGCCVRRDHRVRSSPLLGDDGDGAVVWRKALLQGRRKRKKAFGYWQVLHTDAVSKSVDVQ